MRAWGGGGGYLTTGKERRARPTSAREALLYRPVLWLSIFAADVFFSQASYTGIQAKDLDCAAPLCIWDQDEYIVLILIPKTGIPSKGVLSGCSAYTKNVVEPAEAQILVHAGAFRFAETSKASGWIIWHR